MPRKSAKSALDSELDEALEETFPASDPIAVHDPGLRESRAERVTRRRKPGPIRKRIAKKTGRGKAAR